MQLYCYPWQQQHEQQEQPAAVQVELAPGLTLIATETILVAQL